ncbi:protein kinase [Streptomyces griseosporeus]|uniref:protein kinase domain-containing protein n=1 Tax=Streptomyces griseosporeus TaxID=1910 RepID=UPI0036F5E285
MLHRDDPRSVGGYRLLDRLGAGGMGVVYRARARSGREVAVKVVHAQYAEDAVFRARFRQEIDAVRKVSGAFTAPVVDADPEAVRPWMATQFVPAPSLADRIRAEGPLRGADLRRLALGLVEALRDIHRAGVVHRDLKPANVLMAEDGPRVIDFGISRAAENQTLTETGLLIGTPPFMSPEQLTDSRSVGPASDVFSLGALLAFAATGRGPFDADSPFVAAYRVMNEAPALDAVPSPLREILGRCVAKEAADRPGLEELGREFAEALPEPDPDDASTVTLRRPDLAPTRPVSLPSARRGRLRPLLVATAAAVALAAGVTSWATLGRPDTTATSDDPHGSPHPSSSASARWAALPKGFRPWESSVYAAARSGPKALDATGGGSPGCAQSGSALFCGGTGILPVRVDATTGTVVWRAGIAPKITDQLTYDTTVVGVADGAVLVKQSVTDLSAGSGAISEEAGGSRTGGGAVSATAGAADDQSRTDLFALDATSGRRLWSRTLPVEETADVALAGGSVLASSRDGRSILALAPRDGATRWSVPLPADRLCGFFDIDHRPFAVCETLDEEVTDSLYLSFDPADGTTRRLTGPALGSDVVGVLNGRLLFLESEDQDIGAAGDTPFARLVSLDPLTGTRRTTKLARKYTGMAAVARGTLYFATTGRVTAVSPDTGKELWHTDTTLEQPGHPAVDRWSRTLYVASPTGRLAALDATRGTRLWESYPRAPQSGSGDWSELFAVEGAVVVLTPDGTVLGVNPAHPEAKPASG